MGLWKRIKSAVWLKKKNIACAAGTFALFFLTLSFLLSTLTAYFNSPCRIETDCRLKSITVEDIKSLERQEKDGTVGLSGLAAWRYGNQGQVFDPVSGRQKSTGVVYAYGAMSLVFPARVLSGSYEQAMGEQGCVLTKGLSYALYGSTNTSGCTLKFGGKTYRVAAVIDKEEEFLMLPMEEGTVELAAFKFRDRKRVKQRMEALGF